MKIIVGGKTIQDVGKPYTSTIRVDPSKQISIYDKKEIEIYVPPKRDIVSYNSPTTDIVSHDEEVFISYKKPKFAIIEECVEPIKTESAMQKLRNRLKILAAEHVSFKMTPNAHVKNDKVDLFIDSFSNAYKELYQQMNQFKLTPNGIRVPEQDKVFFETYIAKEKFETFIVSNRSNAEFVKQQIGFTWNCKIDEKSKDDQEIEDVNADNLMGIEFRFKYTSGLSLKNIRDEDKPIREFLELTRMLIKNENVFIQFGFQPAEYSWYKDAEDNVKDLPKRKHVGESSKMKLGYNGFDCCLRVVITSDDKNRKSQIARGLILAIKQLNGDQEFEEKIIKEKNVCKWLVETVLARKINTSLFFKKRMIMVGKEIMNFVKLPKRNLQVDFALNAVERVEPDIPKSLKTKHGILIGHTEFRNKLYEIKLPFFDSHTKKEYIKSILDDFMKSYVFTGSPRMGKDTGIINLIVESAKRGVGAFIPDVIDEKGNDRGMTDSIRDSLPPETIIDLNIGDYFNPIYFGLEDVAALIGENGMNVIADNFVKVLGLEKTSNAQELCALVAKACRCNLYKMYCFLKSRKFAKSVYEQLLKEDELLAMEVKFEYLNNAKAGDDQGAKALRTRLKVILGNPHFKNMMAQEPNPAINFEKWIREHKVVLLRMKKIDIGEVGIQIIMYLLSMKIFWIKKIIATDDCTFIVYNEPKQFISEGLSDLFQDMMTESPKFRLAPCFAFHHPDMLGSRELWNVMQSASLNWFLYKNTNLGMYRSVEEQLKPIDIDMAMKTKQHESIFLPFVGGEQLTPIFVKMLPPPAKRQQMFDNSNLTSEHSKVYGKPVKEVRERIMEIEMSMYNEEQEEGAKPNRKSKSTI